MKKIKVFSTFSGVLGGEIGVDHSKFELVGVSEIEKNACSILRYRASNVKNYGDITKIVPHELPDFDVLTSGFNCFPSGTMVMTDLGYKPIEEIKVGDNVLTHKCRFMPVVKTFNNGKSRVVSLKIMGCHELRVTKDHLMYVREKGIGGENSSWIGNRVFSKPKWVKVENMNKSSFIGIPINQNSVIPKWGGCLVKDGVKLKKVKTINTSDPAFWRVVGRFFADGWTCKYKRKKRKNSYAYRFGVCTGKHKKESLINDFKKLGVHFGEVEARTTYNCHISQQEYYEFFSRFGSRAYNKKILPEILDLPINLLDEFLKGYLSGDGHIENKTQSAFTTTSIDMAYGIQSIVHKVFNVGTSIRKVKVKPTKIIEGRVVNQRPWYRVLISHNRETFYDNGLIWTPFRCLKEANKEVDVFDFEVKEDHSYTVFNLCTHNCQPYSLAGSKKGLNDDRGKVIFDLFKIISAKQPKMIQLENVMGLLSHEEGLTIIKLLTDICNLGYHIDFQVLKATDFGVPQRRDRVFIVCKRDDLVTDQDLNLGFIGKSDTVDRLKTKIIKYHCHNIKMFNFGFPLKANLKQILLDDILEKDVDEKYYISKERFEEVMKNSVIHTTKTMLPVVQSYDKFYKKIVVNNIDANYWKGPDNHGQRTPVLCACSKSHRDDGSVDKRIRVDGTANTINTGEGGFSQSTYNYVVDVENWRVRMFTETETEALMCLPKNWTKWGIDENGNKIEISKSQRYARCGNGVVSRIPKILFTVVERHLSGNI